jgi:hypothetical protein
MTELPEQGIQAVRELSAEQIEDLKLAVQEADRGEFATSDQIADTWKKFGL